MIMNLTEYTTQELEFIISNIELLKKELKNRQIEELSNSPFKNGEVIYTKNEYDNSFLKIKEINRKNNTVIADEIIITNKGSFDFYTDELWDMDDIEWYEYTKIEDPKIFENLLEIINKYDDNTQQLENDTYLKLKNKIVTL